MTELSHCCARRGVKHALGFGTIADERSEVAACVEPGWEIPAPAAKVSGRSDYETHSLACHPC